MERRVFKIAKVAEWDAARARGDYSGSRDDTRDGFIHLSSAAQVRGTLQKHFKDERDLILIAFEAGALGPMLKWESSANGQVFPHLYASLPVAAALWSRPISFDSSGQPIVDEAFLAC